MAAILAPRHGLRVSQAIAQRRDDVNLDAARLWVRRLKNSLLVEHPIAGDELRAIKRYLTIRTDRLPWLCKRRRPSWDSKVPMPLKIQPRRSKRAKAPIIVYGTVPPKLVPNSERRPREYLTPAEVKKLIVARKRGRYRPRNALMFPPPDRTGRMRLKYRTDF
jgi:integrase